VTVLIAIICIWLAGNFIVLLRSGSILFVRHVTSKLSAQKQMSEKPVRSPAKSAPQICLYNAIFLAQNKAIWYCINHCCSLINGQESTPEANKINIDKRLIFVLID
jgi:hypothetical protein